MQQDTQERFPLMRHIKWAAWAGVLLGLAGLIMGHGTDSGMGAFLGVGIGASFGWILGPELYDKVFEQVELPSWVLNLLPHRSRSVQGQTEVREEYPPLSTRTSILADPVVDTSRTSVLAPPMEDKTYTRIDQGVNEDALFAEIVSQKPLPYPRFTLDQVLAHSGYNTYRAIIGRSVSDGIARYLNILGMHFKAIGTTQFGKSTFIAYLLWLLCQTHDTDHLQIAVLDLENRTGKIFNDDPHVASVMNGSRPVRLHARTIKDVCTHMGYLYILMNYRYSLTLEEQEKQPLILMYVEEFLRLKNELKKAMQNGGGVEKVEYLQFMHRFTGLAAQGLKVRMQFIVCTQTDYADDDLRDAFNQITSGAAFCVKWPAAQAAGFTSNDKIADNFRARARGIAVFETTDFNEPIIVPEFNLNDRIRAIEVAELTQASSSRFLVDVSEGPRQPYLVPEPVFFTQESPLPTLTGYGGGQVKELRSQPVTETLEDKVRRAFSMNYTTLGAVASFCDKSPGQVRPLWEKVRFELGQQQQQREDEESDVS